MSKKKTSDMSAEIKAKPPAEISEVFKKHEVSGIAQIMCSAFAVSSSLLGTMAEQASVMAQQAEIDRANEKREAAAYDVPVEDLRLLLASPIAWVWRDPTFVDRTPEVLKSLIRAAKDLLAAGGWEYHG